MDYKENMTQEEFEQAIAQAREGLFSEEELNKRVQSETDKVRTDYSLKMKELEAKLPAEKSEKEMALEQKERELAEFENNLKIQSVLQKNNIPSDLAKYLKCDDVETFESEVVGLLNTQLLNSSFKPENHKANHGITKDEFAKMNYMERQALADSNPTLFDMLSAK